MKLSTSQRKKFRVRNKLKKYSSVNRYRLTVSRSSKNISAQIIDDFKKITLLSATSNQKSLKDTKKTKSEVSTIVAENLAKKAKELKINKIYFDRGIYKYHGELKFLLIHLEKMGWSFNKWKKITNF